MSKEFLCKYDLTRKCIADNCDCCKRHPMYKQGIIDGIEGLTTECEKTSDDGILDVKTIKEMRNIIVKIFS